jgi:hypothetical protein
MVQLLSIIVINSCISILPEGLIGQARMLTGYLESSRFKQTYARLYQEELSRPPEFFLNWQLNAERQRAESVVSTSPSGTPFTMSPVLHPIRNQTSNREC